MTDLKFFGWDGPWMIQNYWVGTVDFCCADLLSTGGKSDIESQFWCVSGMCPLIYALALAQEEKENVLKSRCLL